MDFLKNFLTRKVFPETISSFFIQSIHIFIPKYYKHFVAELSISKKALADFSAILQNDLLFPPSSLWKLSQVIPSSGTPHKTNRGAQRSILRHLSSKTLQSVWIPAPFHTWLTNNFLAVRSCHIVRYCPNNYNSRIHHLTFARTESNENPVWATILWKQPGAEIQENL